MVFHDNGRTIEILVAEHLDKDGQPTGIFSGSFGGLFDQEEGDISSEDTAVREYVEEFNSTERINRMNMGESKDEIDKDLAARVRKKLVVDPQNTKKSFFVHHSLEDGGTWNAFFLKVDKNFRNGKHTNDVFNKNEERDKHQWIEIGELLRRMKNSNGDMKFREEFEETIEFLKINNNRYAKYVREKLLKFP